MVSNLTVAFSHISLAFFLCSGCRSTACSCIVASCYKPSLWVYVSSHCFCWVVFWLDVISFHPLSGGCPRHLGCSREVTLTCHVIAMASVYFCGCSSCNPLWDPWISKLMGKLKTTQPQWGFQDFCLWVFLSKHQATMNYNLQELLSFFFKCPCYLKSLLGHSSAVSWAFN